MHFLKLPKILNDLQRRISNSHVKKLCTQHNVSQFHPGKKIFGYTVDKVATIDELSLTAVSLYHDKTGCQHIHLNRDDSNNVFGVALRTTPRDSTGVSHILEHTALCGSEKYPVRDPFFKMLNRSLSTFMNAMTASDWTLYPFSTQNIKDYNNLMNVYLDSVFYPKLTEQDFRQEGWRLEHEQFDDSNSPIIFKGVVYNEMKGVYSNSQNLYARKLQNYLCPSHTYSVCSGGDPQNITDLTWNQLKEFHSSHYHPSNARFFTYGNFPLESHLELINENVLNNFGVINPDTDVPAEKRWSQSREETIHCGMDPMAPDQKKQTTVSISYLLNDISDVHETSTLSIICNLLLNGEKAPFYQTLLEANIGSDYSPAVGFDSYKKESSFSVGLQGIHEKDIDKVKDLIEQTFDQVIEEGFYQERIDALLHKVELSMKHQTSKFGLYTGMELICPWIHGADPIDSLKVNDQINYFKNKCKENPHYLQERVKHYFKDNKHKLTLIMKPDTEHENKLQSEETSRLSSFVSSLNESEKNKLLDEGIALQNTQNSVEDLSCLPCVTIQDIPEKIPNVISKIIHSGNVPIQINEQPTNNVTYFRCISNISNLPDSLKMYVPLFSNIVVKMGTESMNYKELSQKIDLHTGGLDASTHLANHHSSLDKFEEGVLFSSYCLDSNLEKMFDIWSDIFHSLYLADENRLETLVLMAVSDLTQGIVSSGHMYAMAHASSHLSASLKTNELLKGMTQIDFMKNIAEKKDFSNVIDSLKKIAGHVLTGNNLRCSLNTTSSNQENAVNVLEKFLAPLTNVQPSESLFSHEPEFAASQCSTHFQLPYQVNFVSRSAKTVPFTHTDFSSLQILARLMTNKYLHREIREKGGAYGGGAMVNSSGSLNFFSYRDPNAQNTISSFDGAVEWILKSEFSDQDIDEAKLGVFSKLDVPVPPGDRGQRSFLHGISDEMQQLHREKLFAVKKQNILDVAGRYLDSSSRCSSITILGPENSLTKDKNEWILKSCT